MSQQEPDDLTRLDETVQQQTGDGVARRRAEERSGAALRASTLASDLERDEVAGLLNDAYAQGRLTSDEHAERTARALSARTHGDLDGVLAGLRLVPAAERVHVGRKVLFWVVTVMTSPFLLLAAGFLLGGSDLGDRVFGVVLLVLFAPGLFALNRWAWPRSDGRGWSPRRLSHGGR